MLNLIVFILCIIAVICNLQNKNNCFCIIDLILAIFNLPNAIEWLKCVILL